ncbi:CYTH domain-containing protein [Corallococcus sp. Z5C101001]|uniref:CYTH domain-containing protein n=1 Tax=Corallococcus sp. Z5C101001 TaxID=2596829 RepID=UPI00117EAAD4|nr:CYTH domain-containing protein [Corallococcus sp. Z5C101001]TSC29481.1 CYTH domain-containing protein [Corallococcus sp. Z5C101001]
MQSKLEVETKLEISHLDFTRLLSDNLIKKTTEQLNIYYDFNWILAAASATFRIRIASGRPAVATLKIPLHTQNGQRTSREFETPASQAIASCSHVANSPRKLDVKSHLTPIFRDALLGLNIPLLDRVGYMRNTRHVLELVDVGCIEVDWVRLPDGRNFYEVEIEHDDLDLQRHLAHMVIKQAPSARPSTLSKFERFQRAVAAVRQSDCWRSLPNRSLV